LKATYILAGLSGLAWKNIHKNLHVLKKITFFWKKLHFFWKKLHFFEKISSGTISQDYRMYKFNTYVHIRHRVKAGSFTYTRTGLFKKNLIVLKFV
jgi:hypothetical protein